LEEVGMSVCVERRGGEGRRGGAVRMGGNEDKVV